MLPESVRFLASHVHLVNSIFGPEPAAADTTNALKTQAQKEGSAWWRGTGRALCERTNQSGELPAPPTTPPAGGVGEPEPGEWVISRAACQQRAQASARKGLRPAPAHGSLALFSSPPWQARAGLFFFFLPLCTRASVFLERWLPNGSGSWGGGEGGNLALQGTFKNYWRHIWLSQLGTGECSWRLVGRDQRCCQTSYSTRDGLF